MLPSMSPDSPKTERKKIKDKKKLKVNVVNGRRQREALLWLLFSGLCMQVLKICRIQWLGLIKVNNPEKWLKQPWAMGGWWRRGPCLFQNEGSLSPTFCRSSVRFYEYDPKNSGVHESWCWPSPTVNETLTLTWYTFFF